MAYGAVLGQKLNNTTYTNTQILNPSDATLIGLNSNALPADMFNVLATAGDLHVWRRTTSSWTDYPVSVNPNAYHTGSDAQPAGYTLGAVQNGQFVLSPRYYTGKFTFYYVASLDDISVSDDGVVSIPQTDTISVYGFSDQTELLNAIKGKVLQLYGESTITPPSPFGSGIAFYVPEDAIISQYNFLSGVTIDKYQTVTGYPAIPAGTTIEYLGNLGDKARMQIVSYVGTGTYGSSNPTKITFDSPPKFVFIQSNNTTRRITGLFNCVIPTGIVFAADGSSSIYGRYQPIVSMNGNTITLMSTNNDPGAQMNENGDKYSAIAFA